jgi:amidophosphoribosyltransferase
VGRSFIAPSQALRESAARMKLNPLHDNIAGKRLVVVDDTIVRGTTQRQLVKKLREAGAKEVHLRITAPPVKWPCFYGIDMGDRGELIAAQFTVDEIRDYFGADSLAYLSLDRLQQAPVSAPRASPVTTPSTCPCRCARQCSNARCRPTRSSPPCINPGSRSAGIQILKPDV